MKRTLLGCLFLLILSCCAYGQKVSAYQAGVYQPGLLNLRDWCTIESPGLFFMDYNYWNKSSDYLDRNGNEVTSVDINGSTLNLKTEITGYTNVPVLFWATNLKLFKGRYMASISPMFITSNSNASISSNSSVLNHTSSGSFGGVGDLVIMPLGLGWSLEDHVDLSFLYLKITVIQNIISPLQIGWSVI